MVRSNGLRPRLNIMGDPVEEAMELLAYGYVEQHQQQQQPSTTKRRTALAHPKSRMELQEDLALAIALSESLVVVQERQQQQHRSTKICTKSTPSSEQASVDNHTRGGEDHCSSVVVEDGGTSSSVAHSSNQNDCSNDRAIAMALSDLESSCVADLESIQLDDGTITTNNDYGSNLVVVGAENDYSVTDDDTSEWSCVILGDLGEVLGYADSKEQEGLLLEETTDHWSIVSEDFGEAKASTSLPAVVVQEKTRSQFLPSYKEVLDCCFVDRNEATSGSAASNRIDRGMKIATASKTFVRSVVDPHFTTNHGSSFLFGLNNHNTSNGLENPRQIVAQWFRPAASRKEHGEYVPYNNR